MLCPAANRIDLLFNTRDFTVFCAGCGHGLYPRNSTTSPMDSQVSPTIYINTFSAPEATIRKVHTSRSEENQHGEIFFQEADSSMVWVRVENFGLLLAVTAL